jgi:pimeloyl-ACP methyl ester carboxylesterase
MTLSPPLPATTAVLLPGSGSDDVFLGAAFAEPLAAAGVDLQAHRPAPGLPVVQGYLAALDAAASSAGSRLLVGGVSLGAHVAVQWAARHPECCAGVIAALPAYTGAADGAPAAVAARASAALVRADGLERALQIATAGVPEWLAEELSRAWRGLGGDLAAGLDAAAGHPAPERTELRRLTVPVGVVGCTDDPVHPVAVAREWARVIPRAGLAEFTFAELGADRAALGRAAVTALRTAVAAQ